MVIVLTTKTIRNERRCTMQAKAISKEFQAQADAFRKLLSKPSVHKLMKDCVIGVTKTGCVQVRRGGDVIAALTRHSGKVVIPLDDIKDICPGATSPGDNKHMCWVPFEEISEKLMILRLKDKRTNVQIMEAVYGKGKVSGAQESYRTLRDKAAKEAKTQKKVAGTKKAATKARGKKGKAPSKLRAKAAKA